MSVCTKGDDGSIIATHYVNRDNVTVKVYVERLNVDQDDVRA